jgi:hypothetical protein
VLLNNSFRLVEQHLEDRASGEMQSGYEYTLRMPTLDGNNLLPYISGGWDTVPSRIIDCSARREKEVVEAIIGEAREKLAIDLDEHPVVDRWPSTIGIIPGEGAQKSFPVIGSSHARKLGSALRKAGHHADLRGQLEGGESQCDGHGRASKGEFGGYQRRHCRVLCPRQQHLLLHG